MSQKSGDRFPACAKPGYPCVVWVDASAGGGRSDKDMREIYESSACSDFTSSGHALV
jgi:hypothetical protein